MAVQTSLHIPEYTPQKLMKMPVWEVSGLGTEALQTRVWAEIGACGLAGDKQVEWAFNEAPILHAGQQRTNGAYIQHPLRTVLYAATYGIPKAHQSNILSALLLHDTVEDQSERIINRYGNGRYLPTDDEVQNIDLALQSLAMTSPLTPETLEIIDRVTERPFFISPHATKEQKRALKNRHFFEHTRLKVFNHAGATIVKRADMEDNGVNNHHTTDREKMLRSDVKYHPLWNAFEEALHEPGSLITDRACVKATSENFALGQLRAEKRMRDANISINGIYDALFRRAA